MDKGRVTQTAEATLKNETVFQRGWPDHRREVTVTPRSLPLCTTQHSLPGSLPFTDGRAEDSGPLETSSFPLSTNAKELREEGRYHRDLIGKSSLFLTWKSRLAGEEVRRHPGEEGGK